MQKTKTYELYKFVSCLKMERMRGIEPPLPAWEAGVLPLNHIRMIEFLLLELLYYT